MVHAGLPVRAPLWDFSITVESEQSRLAFDPRGIDRSLPQTGGHCTDLSMRTTLRPMPHWPDRPAVAIARHGIEPCRLAPKLRGAMIAATTPHRSRRPFFGSHFRSE